MDELVERIRKGDVAALDAYLQQVRPQLVAYVERQLGDALRRKVEADDVVQEAAAEAVRLVRERPAIERDPFGWLCQIAQRKLIDAHRRFFEAQKRSAEREVALDAASDNTRRGGLINLLVRSMTTPSRAFSRNAREARLLEALAQLSPEQQEALRLRYVENLPSKEIADRLRKSDAAVRVMLTRALKRLQSLLSDLELS